MFVKRFQDFITEELGQVRHKKVNHIEDDEPKDKSDEKLEKDTEKYLDDKSDRCPRCDEHIDDCRCQDEDPWSTQNYHRVPKGKEQKSKPKQQFKDE